MTDNTAEHRPLDGGIAEIVARRDAFPPRPIEQPSRPRTGVAVLTCMDARLDVYRILGLTAGDAHVIRNAGALVTDDVRLTLAISQHLLGTREILVMHHLDCAMRRVHDHELADAVQRGGGSRPPWRFTTIADPVARVEEAVRLLADDPHLTRTDVVRGYLFDERTGGLREVCRSDRRIS
jgi:carbonic anhydrase